MNFQALWQPTKPRPIAAMLPLLLMLVALAGCQTVPIPDPAVRYIAFGDSTAAGSADRQYWEFLRDDLGMASDSFAGQGRGGETAADGLERLASLLEDRLYPNAQAMLYWQGGADILAFVKNNDPLVALSPNDPTYPLTSQLDAALDTVQANIEQAIASGRQAGLTVYITTYYFFNPNTGQCKPAVLNVLLPAQAQRVNQYILLLNDRIRSAAAAGAVLVDVETHADEILADSANYVDCNHLSDSGNAIVAEVFGAAIQGQP